MKTVLLFRHGETQIPGCKGKKLNCPLSPEGERQTRRNVEHALAAARAHLQSTMVVTSPLMRAARFGEVFREMTAEHGLPQSAHFASPDFIDLDVGAWEGQSWDAIKAKYPDQYAMMRTDGRKLVIPDGEPVDRYVDRVLRAWSRLMRIHCSHLIVVGHSATNVPFLAEDQEKLDFGSQDHGCLNEIHVDDLGRKEIIAKNVTLHSIHA